MAMFARRTAQPGHRTLARRFVSTHHWISEPRRVVGSPDDSDRPSTSGPVTHFKLAQIVEKAVDSQNPPYVSWVGCLFSQLLAVDRSAFVCNLLDELRMSRNSVSSEPTGSSWLPVLLILFVGSGFSALVYEIVWFQLLQLAIGSSAVSLGVLLSTFMGGMCLGSLLYSRVVPRRIHPLLAYAALELAIGALAVVLLFLLPQIGNLYTAIAGRGAGSVVIRAVLCALALLPPTVLMGATLPAIARWMETSPVGVSRLGFFYGANIAGAVAGCLLAGFYLLRIHDVSYATFVAATVNLIVALIGAGLSRLADYRPSYPEQASRQPFCAYRLLVYVVIGFSGMTALAAEVIWARILSLMLGATVYTFSIILAVFLVGLGIGSSLGSLTARGGFRPRIALGLCQLGLCAAIAWAAYCLTQSLPYWPIDVSLSSNPWVTFQMDLMRCVWSILPAAVLWGASFPLALAAAARPEQDPGSLVGRVYAANTVGAIAGSLLASLMLISWLGTRESQQGLIAIAAICGVLMLAPALWESARTRPVAAGSGLVLLLLAVVGSWQLLQSVKPVPAGLIGYGRYLPTYYELPEFLFSGEGMNASVAVSQMEDDSRNFHVSGKVVASSEAQDMRLQRMLGHLPALIHEEPRRALIVGCGAGVTSGSFVVHPHMERIVICEIEPLIPPYSRRVLCGRKLWRDAGRAAGNRAG